MQAHEIKVRRGHGVRGTSGTSKGNMRLASLL